MQAPMIDDKIDPQAQQQAQIQQAQMQQAPAPQDEVQMAKEALGLDTYEQKLAQMQAQLQESKDKAIFEEVSNKYEDVDASLVEKELEKVGAENPQLAEMIKSDPKGLDMLFAKVKTEMQPTETPDEITDSGNSGGNNDNSFNKKVEKGNASEIDLGDFILEQSK